MSKWTNNLTKCLRGGKAFLTGLGLLLLQVTVSASQSVTLTWVPSMDAAVAGFKIYYGPATHAYTNSLTLGLVTNVTVDGLVEGATYYFAATTYGTNGNESDFSNEAIYAIPAIVTPPPVTNPPVVVVTNTPPVVTNPPPIEITNTVPVITNTVPVITNTPPVEVTNTVPVVTNTPPTVTNTPASINQPPTLNPLANLNLTKNVAGQTIGLSGITSGAITENQTLTVTATSSNPNLIKPAINYLSPNATGTLTFKPTANLTGSALITVTVNDGGASNNVITRSFLVVVAASANNTGNKSNLKRPTFNRFSTNSITLAGRSVSLSATVTGSGPLKYQWKFNDAPIAGATSPTLSLKNVKATQSGIYTLTVANDAGSTNASAALTVMTSPAATLSAANRAQDGTFSFQVTGVPGYKYVIQSSTDLSNWSSVKTNTAPFTFTDNSPNADQKFYRSYYSPGI
jgi:hypothetical protein